MMNQPMAGNSRRRGQSLPARIGFAVIGMLLFFDPLPPPRARAQQALSIVPSSPSFALVSVKPSHSGERMTLWPMADAGEVVIKNVSTKYLVEFAYDLQDFQLSGGPEWLDSQKFDIELKRREPSNASNVRPTGDLWEQRRQLIRALLEDRFKLKMNLEVKPTPVYVLVAADGGPRVTERPVAPDAVVSIRVLAEKGRLTMTPGSNEELANALSGQLGCEVVDHTGRSGIYDIALHWTPDSRASLVAAVREQLGLSLEEHIKPVRMYSIDDVAEPLQD